MNHKSNDELIPTHFIGLTSELNITMSVNQLLKKQYTELTVQL
jgi:hypothetical protein